MWMTLTPRSQVAATKPARSVTAPPPTATTASERVKSFCPSTCQQKEATSMCLPSSASGISAVSAVKPAAASSSRTVSPVSRSARGWMTRTRLTRSPSRPGQAGQQAAAHNDVVVLAGRLPGDFDDG